MSHQPPPASALPAPPVDDGQPELRRAALALLQQADPRAKADATRALLAARDELALDPAAELEPTAPLPGRPLRPTLLPALQVPQRSLSSAEGRAGLIHAIAHIEFNAINLALDAIWRFAGLPSTYYFDWLQVAGEEALHFTLLREHLQGLGHDYGDFPAHDGLWAMTARTAHDPLARMALVPRTLEARGLDAAPPLQKKFAAAGDARAVELLGLILRDEIGHVAIGNRWYRWLCEREGLDPVAAYPRLAEQYDAPKPRPPLNLGAREAAGFTAEELEYLGRPPVAASPLPQGGAADRPAEPGCGGRLAGPVRAPRVPGAPEPGAYHSPPTK